MQAIIRTTCLVSAVVCLLSCAPGGNEQTDPPNFLILLAGDMGVETLACYGVGSRPARTPNLDRLCASGMRFDNFWSQATGSQTYSSILTGQYAFRNGAGADAYAANGDFLVPALPADAGFELRQSSNAGAHPWPAVGHSSLPRALAGDDAAGYTTAALGKWYLADEHAGVLDHPAFVGFDHFAGNMAGDSFASYFAWSEVVNGRITGGRSGYITSATIDDTIAWFDYTDTGRPWLISVAFNAPQAPLGAPPARLLRRKTTAQLDSDEPRSYFVAMIEALDTEIGRLLEAIGDDELDNTYVFFLGGNGTAASMTTAPYAGDRAGGTLYQGGINVPLIVRGPGIAQQSVTKSLANPVDLFATVLDLAGREQHPVQGNHRIDAVSLTPILAEPTASPRDFAYADLAGLQQGDSGDLRAIRNTRYKLLVDLQNDREEFYDLAIDPYEQENLLRNALGVDAHVNYALLVAQLDTLLSGS